MRTEVIMMLIKKTAAVLTAVSMLLGSAAIVTAME